MNLKILRGCLFGVTIGCWAAFAGWLHLAANDEKPMPHAAKLALRGAQNTLGCPLNMNSQCVINNACVAPQGSKFGCVGGCNGPGGCGQNPDGTAGNPVPVGYSSAASNCQNCGYFDNDPNQPKCATGCIPSNVQVVCVWNGTCYCQFVQNQYGQGWQCKPGQLTAPTPTNGCFQK